MLQSLEDMFSRQLDVAIEKLGEVQNVPQMAPPESPAVFRQVVDNHYITGFTLQVLSHILKSVHTIKTPC